MKQKIRLSCWQIRCLFLCLALFSVSSIFWLKNIIFLVLSLPVFSMLCFCAFRARLVIDYNKKQILYYSILKRQIAFSDIEDCYEYESVFPHTKINLAIKKKDDSQIIIDTSFLAFKRNTTKEVRQEIIKKILDVKLNTM